MEKDTRILTNSATLVSIATANLALLRLSALLVSCAMASVVSSALAGDIVWIEAERFADRGGWTNDAQFIDQMGSPYLLAVGLGQPVKDAVTHVDLPQAGKWRLWVRGRDWAPEHHPGRFRLSVNGKEAGPVFGASGLVGWRWEDGGVHQWSGRIELRLRDLTGYYARCDAIVLAADLQWKPPNDSLTLAALRRDLGGVSREVKDMGQFDVVVLGGGLAGCTAAVAAARGGASVALIQNRPVLGGNASPEILVPPVGVWPHGRYLGPLDPRETGLVEEYRTIGNQRVSEGMLYAERLARFVGLEPSLKLYLDTHAAEVQMDCRVPLLARCSLDAASSREPLAGSGQAVPHRRIAAVEAVDVNTGQRLRFGGKMFIDCTGDSAVSVAAGAEFRHGKEPKSMYHEPYAPETASRHTMGNGLKYFHQDTGRPQPFEAPPWAYRFPSCESFGPGRHPRFIANIEIDDQWKFELGGLQDTYADAEEIRDDLLRLIYGLWDHTKNHCSRDKARAATHKLVWVGHVAGKRENRRLMGDYVLTQNDIGAQTRFPDRVAYGGWTVDDHHSAGFFHQGSFGTHYDDPRNAHQGVPFSIPLRCLYSRNVENLMMAGRNISASHMAMSDTRVMLTCAVMGQAAGTAAALCVEHGMTPRVVGQKHLERLQQQLLKDGAYLIDLPNQDPRDLARQAHVAASSEAASPSGERMAAANVIDGYARAVGEKPHAWAPDRSAPGPHWVELSWSKAQAFNVVHVTFQTAALAPRRLAIEAWQDGAWRQLAEVTDNRHRRRVMGVEQVSAGKLRVVLGEARGICEIRVYDEPQRLVEVAQRVERNLQSPDRGPWLLWDHGKPPEQWTGRPAKAK